MRLHFLLVRRVPPVPSPVLTEVTQRLEEKGFTVTGFIPEEVLTRTDLLNPDADLVIVKSHTELALSLAGLLNAEGGRLLNPYGSCVAAQDKVTATRRLRAAGVPVPATWVTGDRALAREACERGPLVVKPVRGHRGTGVVVVRCREDLAAIDVASESPLIVQDLVTGPGEDLKVYVAGDHVAAVRKPFDPHSFARPGRPVHVSDEVRDLAVRSGVALGLGLYGLDVIEGPDGPVVVDVNYFPGYKGVPDAAVHIASYIEAYARGRVALVEGGTLMQSATAPAPGEVPRPVVAEGLTASCNHVGVAGVGGDRLEADCAGAPGAVERPPARRGEGCVGRVWGWTTREAKRLGQHPVTPLVAEGFFSRLSFGVISFALPLFAHQLGLSIAAIGVLLSLNLVVAIALKPLMGRATDRITPKTTLLMAIVLRTAVCLLLVLSSEPWHLFLVRAVHGLSIALRDPSAAVLVADAGGERYVARCFAWYQTAKTVAGSVGRAAAGILIAATGGYAGVFAVALVLSALPLGVVARGIRPARARRAVEAGDLLGEVTAPGAAVDSAASRRPVLAFASVGFLITGSAYLLANLFPLFATEYAGLNPATVGAAYLVGSIFALTGPLWGHLADSMKPRLVLSLRSIGNVGSSLVYLLAPNAAGIIVGRALDDTGKAAFRPAWGSLMAQVASRDPSHRGRIMAWLGVGEDAGEVAGPLIAAVIWTAWGVPALLLFRVVAAAVAEVVTVATTRRFERHADGNQRSPAQEVLA